MKTMLTLLLVEATLCRTPLLFVVILLLLCIIVVVVTVNARKLYVKNCSLLNRIREQEGLERRFEQLRERLVKQNREAIVKIDGEGDGIEEENQDLLYMKLRELMKNPLVFTNPDMNRKTLAASLGTNEKYIFMLIKEYYGTSISEYINNLRLNYARQLLIAHRGNRTVEDIALEAGFNSRSAFYRLFKEYYGMTPAECRRYAAEAKRRTLKKEENEDRK